MKVEYASSTAAAQTPCSPAIHRSTPESGGKETGAGADRVTLSPVGRMAARGVDSLGSVFGVAPRADGTIHLDDVRDAFLQETTALRKTLDELFQANGIDTSHPIDLVNDQDGRVRVSGAHPDKARIESLLNDDRDLSARLQQASNMGAFLEVAKRNREFSGAYANNPKEAVSRYANLFGNAHDGFTLRYQASGLTGQA